METVDRYKRFGGSRTPFEGLRKMSKEAEQLPKKKPSAPELADLPKMPTSLEEYFEVPKAATGLPGIPESKMPRPPVLGELPEPKINLKEASKAARMIGRIAGGMVGGAAGFAVGHPYFGVIGGMQGGESLVNWMARRKAGKL